LKAFQAKFDQQRLDLHAELTKKHSDETEYQQSENQRGTDRMAMLEAMLA